METIRNYLETMFLKLPNTPEVYKAKNELWQMMEDKYTELKEEGKSENEAVGIVISEFGNLDELANDLGISQFVESQPMPQGKTLSRSYKILSCRCRKKRIPYRTRRHALCSVRLWPDLFRCFYCILSAKRKSSGCMRRVHYVRTHRHCCWIIHLFQCTDEPLELFKERTFCY